MSYVAVIIPVCILAIILSFLLADGCHGIWTGAPLHTRVICLQSTVKRCRICTGRQGAGSMITMTIYRL